MRIIIQNEEGKILSDKHYKEITKEDVALYADKQVVKLEFIPVEGTTCDGISDAIIDMNADGILSQIYTIKE